MKLNPNPLIPWNRRINLSKVESKRVYRFPKGEFVEINEPQLLIITENGHRLLSKDGVSHYIPYGWIELSWENIGERSFFCEGTKDEQDKMLKE